MTQEQVLEHEILARARPGQGGRAQKPDEFEHTLSIADRQPSKVLPPHNPDRVKTLSLHSAWPKTHPFLRTVAEGWRVLAQGLGSVADMVIMGIFPWCFTPGFYSAQTELIEPLAAFVRGRPAQPVEAFLRQAEAVTGHDAAAQLARITAPTLVTFGRFDVLTSTRFADALTGSIKSAELHVFEDCAHAPIYQNMEAFNQCTLAFLTKHAG
jgi:3-oxoadipate enol-lactonase